MQKIVLGSISGVFGVKGWVKVFSHTEPREAIVDYADYWLGYDGQGDKPEQWQSIEIVTGQRQGKTVVLQIAGVNDRDAAAKLIGQHIAIERSGLAELSGDEYYWHDLVGCTVQHVDQEVSGQQVLGSVKELFATGANDVLVVQQPDGKELLIPWVLDQVVKTVDLEQRLISVDWDGEYFDEETDEEATDSVPSASA